MLSSSCSGVPHLPGSLCSPGHLRARHECLRPWLSRVLSWAWWLRYWVSTLGLSHLSAAWPVESLPLPPLWEDFLASHVTVCHTSKGATDASCGWDVQRTVPHPLQRTKKYGVEASALDQELAGLGSRVQALPVIWLYALGKVPSLLSPCL